MTRRRFTFVSVLSLILVAGIVFLWDRSNAVPWGVAGVRNGTAWGLLSASGEIRLLRYPNWPYPNASARQMDGIYRGLGIPYPLILIGLAVLWLIWLNRFHRYMEVQRRGLCPVCGYDLRASPDRCPECGTPVSPDLMRKPVS